MYLSHLLLFRLKDLSKTLILMLSFALLLHIKIMPLYVFSYLAMVIFLIAIYFQLFFLIRIVYYFFLNKKIYLIYAWMELLKNKKISLAKNLVTEKTHHLIYTDLKKTHKTSSLKEQHLPWNNLNNFNLEKLNKALKKDFFSGNLFFRNIIAYEIKENEISLILKFAGDGIFVFWTKKILFEIFGGLLLVFFKPTSSLILKMTFSLEKQGKNFKIKKGHLQAEAIISREPELKNQ